MQTAFNTRFTDDMGETLAEHYLQWLPFVRSAVEKVVDTVGSREFVETALELPLPDRHWEALVENWLVPYRSYLQRSGKMIRPYLVCLCLEAYGKNPGDYTTAVGIAEIIHSASLVLDDIADDSECRRGGPTAHQQVGLRTAGAMANYWLHICFELLWRERETFGLGRVSALMDEIAWEHWVTGFGTTIDVTWPWQGKYDGKPEHYLQSVVHRSTSYTYRLPLKIGAIAAGASHQQMKRLGEFGEELGLAFQVIDDMLNVKPVDEGWGKKVAEDMTQGKVTLQVLTALERMDGPKRNMLKAILESKTTDLDVLASGVRLLEESGAFANSEKTAKGHISASLKLAENMDFLPEKHRRALTELVTYVIDRKR